MKYNIEQIKVNTSLSALYENLTGWQLRNNAGNCPFHDSKSKTSFSIKDDNYFKCFSCGKKGDAVKFVMLQLNKSFPDACLYLGGETLPDNEKPLKIARKPPIIEPLPELAETTKQIYQYFFEQLTLTDAGKLYLLSRGLSDAIIEQYKIKSIDDYKPIYKQLLAEYTVEQLHDAGLTQIGKDDKPYFIFYLPCVLFSIFEDNLPIYFSSRNLKSDVRFFKLSGVKQRYFHGDLSADKIYILESLIDALSFQQITGNNNFIVLSGLNNYKYLEIKAKYPNKTIITVFDNDAPGLLAKSKISENLGYEIPCLNYDRFKQHFSVKFDCKDVNDILKIKEIKAGNQAVIKAQIPKFKDQDCYNDYLQNSSLINAYAKDKGRNPDAVAGDYVDYLFGYDGTDQMAILKAIGEAG